jgi:hypothetical protein
MKSQYCCPQCGAEAAKNAEECKRCHVLLSGDSVLRPVLRKFHEAYPDASMIDLLIVAGGLAVVVGLPFLPATSFLVPLLARLYPMRALFEAMSQGAGILSVMVLAILIWLLPFILFAIVLKRWMPLNQVPRSHRSVGLFGVSVLLYFLLGRLVLMVMPTSVVPWIYPAIQFAPAALGVYATARLLIGVGIGQVQHAALMTESSGSEGETIWQEPAGSETEPGTWKDTVPRGT